MKQFFIAFLVYSGLCFGQSPWVATNAPTTARYDDLYFLTPDTGWAIGGGAIYHTVNGGVNWVVQKNIATYGRSIEFSDKNNGFAGALESNGQHVFYKTTDGGVTWTDISSVISGTNRGICGICCVNNAVTYAVGVYASPAYVLKTIDGGNNWTQINMSAYANALVDVQFTDANNGYVTGQSNIAAEGAVILKTMDGGSTWAKVFTSNLPGEYLWKIQNLDGINWFASIEAGFAPGTTFNNVFAKSTDGGNTWITKPVGVGHYFQGIGFIDTQRGWVGNNELFETIDGGDTWTEILPFSTANNFDRFQKVNSTTAYFSSSQIFKLSNSPTSVKENTKGAKAKWLSVSPNPTDSEITYRLQLPNKSMYYARLFNLAGELVWEEVNQKEKGSHAFTIQKKLQPGIYFVYVMFNEGVECEKVIVE